LKIQLEKGMKKLVGWLAPSALFVATMMLAQTPDIAGTWQGSIDTGKATLRMVVKVSKAEGDNPLKAVMYSIDQGGTPIQASSFTQQGSNVKMLIALINGTFEGKLSADGNSLDGTWSQGGGVVPFVLTRANADTAWTIPAPPVPLKPMAADVDPVFEVATIKPSRPEAQGRAITLRGRQVITLNTPLEYLISFAYGVNAKQIENLPDWAREDRYDITAVPENEGLPNDKQLKTMIQKLLADRFKLGFHRDKKELSVYAITVDKGGPKLTKNDTAGNSLPGIGFQGLGVMPGRNATIADLASVLQTVVLDRPIVDQTGLQDRYDFLLRWTPDEFQFTGLGVAIPKPSDNATAPDLFTAFREQLGLKLDSTKAPTEVLVIDRAEKPTPN
jgi:bla regulator protein blaR1